MSTPTHVAASGSVLVRDLISEKSWLNMPTSHAEATVGWSSPSRRRAAAGSPKRMNISSWLSFLNPAMPKPWMSCSCRSLKGVGAPADPGNRCGRPAQSEVDCSDETTATPSTGMVVTTGPYDETVPPRRSPAGPPRVFLATGEWPDGVLRDDAPVAARYALELSRRLRDATEGRALAVVAEDADIARSTLYDLLQGRTWADLQTLAKLEVTLGSRLWPELAERAFRQQG